MNVQVTAPGGFIPQSTIAFGTRDDAATDVSWTSGLPVESAAGARAAAAIAAGASLSATVDLDRQRLHRVVLPATWTAAVLTVQVSGDEVQFADL